VNWVEWVKDPGFLGSLVYITVAIIFIYFMVTYQGKSNVNKQDSDTKEKQQK
jgi:hypothetical protein